MIGKEKLAEKFGADTVNGLSAEKARDLLTKFGENGLTKKDVVPWYILFLKEMLGFFSLLLWFGSALCFIGFIL